MLGSNPLVGPNVDALGVRFPDMTYAYDCGLRALALDAAASVGVPLQRGVYLATLGPSYETPAEIRAFRALGADAVACPPCPGHCCPAHGRRGSRHLLHHQPRRRRRRRTARSRGRDEDGGARPRPVHCAARRLHRADGSTPVGTARRAVPFPRGRPRPGATTSAKVRRTSQKAPLPRRSSAMVDVTDDELVHAARAARAHAWAPFSTFAVGAALRHRDGRIVTGCNVENATYGLTNCAERVAALKAIPEGMRPGEFTAVAVVASTPRSRRRRAAPAARSSGSLCGDIPVVLATPTEVKVVLGMRELLPRPFDGRFLSRRLGADGARAERPARRSRPDRPQRVHDRLTPYSRLPVTSTQCFRRLPGRTTRWSWWTSASCPPRDLPDLPYTRRDRQGHQDHGGSEALRPSAFSQPTASRSVCAAAGRRAPSS